MTVTFDFSLITRDIWLAGANRGSMGQVQGDEFMMRDDDHEQRCDEGQKWRAQIELPAEMVESFREWWDSEGWWSFRAWHQKTSGADSEWENFMRQLCGETPTKRLPAISDPTDPKVG